MIKNKERANYSLDFKLKVLADMYENGLSIPCAYQISWVMSFMENMNLSILVKISKYNDRQESKLLNIQKQYYYGK